jgi:cyclic pyranopterin phosphate synthase
LRDAGLHRITVSLDALDPALFRTLSGGRGTSRRSCRHRGAQRAGFDAIKLNCVVQRGVNEARCCAGGVRADQGHVLRFIEYMDVGTCNGWRATAWCRPPSCAIACRRAGRCVRSTRTIAAKSRRASAMPMAAASRLRAVRSSAPFCGDCHRARVSADGQLYTCCSPARPCLRPWRQGEDALVAQVRGVDAARGSLQRIARRATRVEAARRDVPGGG